jgi:hypothetical protein
MVPAAITSADMMAMVIRIVRRPARMIATARPGAGALAIGPAAHGVATVSGRGRGAAGRAALGDRDPAMIEDGQTGHVTVDRSVPAATGIDEMTTAVVTADPRPGTDAPAALNVAVGIRAIAVHATPTARPGAAIGPHGGIATTPAQETATAAQAAAGRLGGIAATLPVGTAMAAAIVSAAIGRLGAIGTTLPVGTATAAQAAAGRLGAIAATLPVGTAPAAAIAPAAIGRLGAIGTTPPAATAAAVDATANGRRAATAANGADTRHVAPTAAGRAQTGAVTSAATIAAGAGSSGTAIGAERAVIVARVTRPGAATAGATNPDRIPRGIDRTARRRSATGIPRRGRRAQVVAADPGVTTPPIAVAAQGSAATIAVRAVVMRTAGDVMA